MSDFIELVMQEISMELGRPIASFAPFIKSYMFLLMKA